MMSRRTRAWSLAALLGTLAATGALPLQAAYIVCYAPDHHQSRISCEAACQERERLVQTSEDEWAGCEAEVPYCGTVWSEWEPDELRGGAVGAADPCPAGCWRTVTIDGQFRTENGASQVRWRWQCQGTKTAS